MMALLHHKPEDGVMRHKKGNHLPRAMVRAAEIIEVAQADNLVDRLKDISRETQRILAESRSGSLLDNETALRAIARLEKQIELEAKLIGELGSGRGTTVNILVAPEWVMLRGVILGALEPYPEARSAVAQALQTAGALSPDHKSIEIAVRPRKGSAAVCSRCPNQPTIF